MRKRTLYLVLLGMLLAGLVLVACGGDQQAQPTEPPAQEEPTEPAVEEEPTEAPEPTATEEEPAEEEEATPEEEATEEVERPEGGLLIWADTNRAPIMQNFGAQFEEEFGVPVAVQEIGFGDIRDQVKIAGPAGEGPDIFVGAHDWLGELVINGVVAEMDLGAKEDQFLDASIDSFTYNGTLYGMPYATENLAFFYNTDLIDEPPTTWSEVTEVAAQLEDEGSVTQGYVLQQADPYHFYPIQTAFGGYVFGQDEQGQYDPSDVGIDSEGSLEAAQWLGDMVAEGHMEPGIDWETAHVMFESGDAAMILTGPWALPRLREAGVPFAIADIPDATEEGQPFLGSQGFMISAFSEDPLLAQTFLTEFIATEEAMQAIYDEDQRPPAFLPVRDAIEDDDLAALAAAGIEANPMPAIPEMASVWTAWGDAITLVLQGEDPAATFENAAEQIRTAIQGE